MPLHTLKVNQDPRPLSTKTDVEIVITGNVDNISLLGGSPIDITGVFIKFDMLLAHIENLGINTVLERIENLPIGNSSNVACSHDWATYTGLHWNDEYCKKCGTVKKCQKN